MRVELNGERDGSILIIFVVIELEERGSDERISGGKGG